MVNLLGLPMRKMKLFRPEEYQIIVLVDAASTGRKNLQSTNAKPHIIIDHHRDDPDGEYLLKISAPSEPLPPSSPPICANTASKKKPAKPAAPSPHPRRHRTPRRHQNRHPRTSSSPHRHSPRLPMLRIPPQADGRKLIRSSITPSPAISISSKPKPTRRWNSNTL